MEHAIHPDHLSLDTIDEVVNGSGQLRLSDASQALIKNCRDWLDKKLEQTDELLYGINTGFGSLCNIRIPDAELHTLQENLMRSHACGVGNTVPPEVVRYMLLLKIQSLSYGHSGIRPETVARLVDMFNMDLLPVVYEQGSLGASGDLAPLAHLCLPLAMLPMGKLSTVTSNIVEV